MRSNIQTEEIYRVQLREIISIIQGISVECKWFLSSNQLIELLGIRKEDYYKILYSFRNSVFNPAKLTGFHEEEAYYLCQLLEIIMGLGDIEDEFIHSGIYFNEKSLGMIRENFINNITLALSRHRVDKDLLLLLSSATIHFDDAFDTYFYDKFSMDRIISLTIEEFLETNQIDPFFGGEIFLKNYLDDQVQYKKIPFEKLTEEYRERYHYELFGRMRNNPLKNKIPKEMRALFQFFDLDYDADKKKLNARYKELLKIYHPDINKNGLEKTKEIIQKYKKLSSLLKT
ncbi:MAG: molecular chaperone DnaJ [Spirochaetia bacterium]|nr:molecular chaperone DnaJ [Spirochaetia bacterium]